MRQIKAQVKNCETKLLGQDRIVEDTINLVELLVEFDEGWEGYTKYIFIKEPGPYRLELTDGNSIKIPNECILKSGGVEFAFFGILGDKQIIQVWEESPIPEPEPVQISLSDTFVSRLGGV